LIFSCVFWARNQSIKYFSVNSAIIDTYLVQYCPITWQKFLKKALVYNSRGVCYFVVTLYLSVFQELFIHPSSSRGADPSGNIRGEAIDVMKLWSGDTEMTRQWCCNDMEEQMDVKFEIKSEEKNWTTSWHHTSTDIDSSAKNDYKRY